MRAPKTAMLIGCLALWGGQALAQSSPQQSSPQPPSPPQPPRYSADGLYNLANSYARAGKPGLAVLNYSAPALLAPNDADINANLEYIRASAHVPTEPRARFARIALAVNPHWRLGSGVLGITLAGVGLLARKNTPRFKWAWAGGILIGVTLIALTVSNAMLLWPRMHAAVVLINQTPARVSPVPMGGRRICIAGSGDCHDDSGARGFHTRSHSRRPDRVGCSSEPRRRRAVRVARAGRPSLPEGVAGRSPPRGVLKPQAIPYIVILGCCSAPQTRWPLGIFG